MAVGDKLPVVMGAEKAVADGVATLDADGKLVEAQKPAYTGEEIPVSGKDGTSLSAALSNKADSSMGYLPGESDIFAWAEQQQISCCFLVGTQVTNTPEPGFYVGELSIGAKGYEFRSIKLTQNTTGKTWVSVYMTITGEWVWTDWMPYATATPPQEYDLPLAEGWQAIIPSLYAKNQFSEVTINARLKFTGNFERGTVFATLPEGYRPNKQVTVFARVVNSQNQSNFGHIDITQDGEMFLYADGAAGAPLNEVFMPSISFIAGS